MSKNHVSGSRTRRVGAALTMVAVAFAGAPAVAQAEPATGSGSAETATSAEGSVTDLIGELPEEIVVGGPVIGSEGLRNSGSGDVVDLALSVGQVTGSLAPFEAIGSAGGSAVASVASSGLVPGSAYVNPPGSLGSGTIGIGSVAIPEYVIPVLGVQLAGGAFAALGERQEVGQLSPEELDFWHGVVEGSAQGGAAIQEAATGAGVELPGELTGSISAVQIAAEQDPHADNEQRRAEAEAAAAAAVTGEIEVEG